MKSKLERSLFRIEKAVINKHKLICWLAKLERSLFRIEKAVINKHKLICWLEEYRDRFKDDYPVLSKLCTDTIYKIHKGDFDFQDKDLEELKKIYD